MAETDCFLLATQAAERFFGALNAANKSSVIMVGECLPPFRSFEPLLKEL